MLQLKKTMDQNLIFKEILKDELEQFDVYLRDALSSSNQRIATILEHAFKVSGKRIRPVMVLLVAKAFGKITPATYYGAITVELLHTATLIHDDVIDESSMRRGQPSANAVFDNKKSVLAGDYLLSSAVLQSVKTESLEIVEIIAELGKNLSEGELNQFELAHEVIIDEHEYFEVIDKKTASLLQACTKIGAITGGADRHAIEDFGAMGRDIGLAFQIRDDIFDYYSKDVGKPTGNDIREGKITLPLIYALQHAPEEVSEKMIAVIRSKDYTAKNIEMLLNFAKTNGGIEYAEKKMDKCLKNAENIVRRASIDEDYKMILDFLFRYLRDRKY